MQLVDSKLYIANATTFGSAPRRHGVGNGGSQIGGVNCHRRRVLMAWLRGTSASERLLGMMLAGFIVAASPALVATVRSTVALSLQILSQVGHAGFIAFQIFGR
jgi:hypothetical protein